MLGKSLGKYRDFGILILRVGLGIMLLAAHGAPKLFAGPERWAAVGRSMENLGIDFAPAFWGLMAGSSEFFGGALLVVGLFVRPVSLLLIFVVFVAAVSIYSGSGDFFGGHAQPVEMGITLLGLFVLGAGRYSIDQKLGLN